jgi:hypothetical protein
MKQPVTAIRSPQTLKCKNFGDLGECKVKQIYLELLLKVIQN